MERILPKQFIVMLREAVGNDAADALVHTLVHEPPIVSVRVNPAKGASVPAHYEPVLWEPLGFYLPERPLFAADPAWHQGIYYVQDASSMAIGTLADQLADRYFDKKDTISYLDACAAPGGKTIGAIDALGSRAFVVANEADKRRAAILAENIARRGAADVAVLCGSAQRLGSLTESFDIIAADAPCSGEGMMRKEPEAVAQWTPGLVESCSSLQKDIVESLWPALKPGGIFIYSTCTFNRREDDDVVRFMADNFGAEIIDIDTTAFPGALKGEYGLRFLPGRVKGEGLFLAALRKPGEKSEKSDRRLSSLTKADPGMSDFARRVIENPENYIISGSSLISRHHADIAARLAAVKRIIRIGLPLGEIKGRDIVPSHELAMSTILRPEAFPSFELPYSAAMNYLRGEAIPKVPDNTPRGFATPTWQGRPLGFAKNIGRRANNLYPDALRLRMQTSQLPDNPPTVI